MPPTDLTTVNDPRLYMIGAGIPEINLNDPVTGLPTGYQDVGNATVLTPTNSDDRFKKNSSRDRYRAEVANLLLRRNTDIQIDLDEWSAFNIALFYQANRTAQAAQVATPIVAEVLTTAALKGSSYRTAKYGPISAVTVNNSTTSTLLVLGVDYEISDPNVGIIRILPGTVLVATGDDITISYTPTAYAAGLVQWDIGTISLMTGALRFISDPANGPRILYDYWKVQFRPNGAVPLINNTNENTPLSIIASVQSDIVNHPTNPIGRMLQLPA